MDASVNIINWFEISVSDMARAKKFYETVFSITMEETDMGGMKMAMFPYSMGGKVSGALVLNPAHQPANGAVRIYFNAHPDLQTALSRAEAAGGKVVMPKTKISDDIGYMAFFTDTEGNQMAMHSGM